MNWKLMICAIFGHSNILTNHLGFHDCARCGERMFDTLTQAIMSKGEVIVGHDCQICRDNYKKLTWKDKFFTPNPFIKDMKDKKEEKCQKR